MNGTEWMKTLRETPDARGKLPLELREALPLPGRKGPNTVEYWYYRLPCTAQGPQLYSPERYVLWDADAMKILQMEQMEPMFLGTAMELVDAEQCRREKAYLDGIFTDFLNGIPADQDEITAEWLKAQPKALRQWLRENL